MNFRQISHYIHLLPEAMITTLILSIEVVIISFFLGIIGAILSTNNSKIVRAIIYLYVEFLRNVPLIILLYLVYFGLPELGFRVGGFVAALLAMSMNSAAFMTEILRGGLAAINRGQYEAGYCQGFTSLETYRYIILPQIVRIVYAPLGNQCIAILIGSSLASVVSVNEMTSWMDTTGARSFRYIEAFIVIGLGYLILCQTVNVMRILLGKYLFSTKNSQRV